MDFGPMTASEVSKRKALKEIYDAHEKSFSPHLKVLRAQANFVPGMGSVSPAVVFIGEAPGGTENRMRRPFCGPSGRMLDELLAGISLSRDDVWITNCVKYRPDERNRNPTQEEKDASWPYLRRELAILDCSYLVVLGAQPLSVFLPGRRHDVVRGHWREHYIGRRVYQLLPLYHPAVGVYQRSRRPLLHQEFSKILEKVKT